MTFTKVTIERSILHVGQFKMSPEFFGISISVSQLRHVTCQAKQTQGREKCGIGIERAERDNHLSHRSHHLGIITEFPFPQLAHSLVLKAGAFVVSLVGKVGKAHAERQNSPHYA